MIKYCLEKWDKNQSTLRKYLETENISQLTYKKVVKLAFAYILNDDTLTFDLDNITEIDDGDYQGTLLFLIPFDTYQPSEAEYFMTYVDYGSCSVCDTLQSIQDSDSDTAINDLMLLCKDIISNCIVPYNKGWRFDDRFKEVEFSQN